MIDTDAGERAEASWAAVRTKLFMEIYLDCSKVGTGPELKGARQEIIHGRCCNTMDDEVTVSASWVFAVVGRFDTWMP